MSQPPTLSGYAPLSRTGATLSPCGTYRYTLWRTWAQSVSRLIAYVMLNPSTADETVDDPTIRKCIGFAKQLEFDGLWVFNLFAYRCTSPSALPKDAGTAIGPDNDRWLRSIDTRFGMVVAAWGAKGGRWNRDRSALEMLRQSHDVYCLRKTKEGHPEHPLYIPYTAKPALLATNKERGNSENIPEMRDKPA